MDVNWQNESGTFNTWFVGESGDGWADGYQCTWWLAEQNVIMANTVQHQVWDSGGITDTGNIIVWITTSGIQE